MRPGFATANPLFLRACLNRPNADEFFSSDAAIVNTQFANSCYAFEMNNNNLLKFGIAGTAIAALCCFTPVLVILLGVVGLSAVVGYLDIVLLPALGIFVLITLYALWKRQTA